MPQIKIQTEFYIPDEELEQGIEKALKNNPDLTLVVRCKDCKHHERCEMEDLLFRVDCIENPYCAAGERITDG